MTPIRAPWHAEHVWTAARVAALLPRHAPDLAGRAVAPIGQGWDNAAFRIGDEVLRFPLRDEVVPHLRTEAAVLPALDLPLAVPRITRVLEPGPGLPVPALGYRWLPGTPLDRADAPVDGTLDRVLDALDALHATMPPVPVAGWEQGGEALRDAAASVGLGAQAAPVVARWEALPPAPPVLLHDDLGACHVLTRDGRPKAIIDWGDLAWGDPARDLVGLLAWAGAPALTRALARRGADLTQVDRADAWWGVHRLWDHVVTARHGRAPDG